jgi:GNAT superfamily N-acetyltransferase
MIIEKAKFKDTNEIAKLALNLFQYHSNLDIYYENNNKSLSVAVKTYGEWIKSRNFQFYVAKDKDLIVGFIIGKIEKEEPIYFRKKKGIVIALFIEKKYRRKGLANNLYDKLVYWFKDNNVNNIEIYVHAKNKGALKTWKKFGFLTDSYKMRKAI